MWGGEQLIRIFLRFFVSSRNLLPCKRKNHLGGGFSKVQQVGELLNRGNRVYKTAATKTVLPV